MPYQSPLLDTLIVDGTDLQTLPGLYLDDLWFLKAPGLRRGDNEIVPRRRGRRGTNQKVLDSYTFTVPVTLTPEDGSGVVAATEILQRAQVTANLRTLAAAIGGDNGLVSLTRRESNLSSGYDTHTAAGEFVTGLTPTGGRIGAVLDLQFINLDGGWWDGSAWLVP